MADKTPITEEERAELQALITAGIQECKDAGRNPLVAAFSYGVAAGREFNNEEQDAEELRLAADMTMKAIAEVYGSGN